MQTAVEVSVTGRVQGVGFRWNTLDEAHRLGVHGWVRNEPDGSVSGWFEGPQEAVDALVEWCRSGPRWAGVEHVRTSAVTPRGHSSFEVR